MIKVGVTGGIGSGKSRLCHLLSERGVACYDSDRRARELMSSDSALKEAIVDLFGGEAYGSAGELNRAYLGAEVFSDPAKREALNGVVHPAVKRDFVVWCEEQASRGDAAYVLLESAILFGSGLEEYVDYTVAVLAPEEIRLERVVTRDGSTLEQVKARMAAQMSDDELHQRADYTIVNIFEEDLAGSALRLDQIFCGKATMGRVGNA